MDYLGHKKLEKDNGIYSSIDGIQGVGGLVLLIREQMGPPGEPEGEGGVIFVFRVFVNIVCVK